MSYIVRNCPCYEFGFCTSHHIKVRGCINCSDCVVKQVIEKCKEHPFKDCACGDDILQLFDIEEINK